MLVNSAFFGINHLQFFHRDLPVFSLILTEALAEYLLIQLSFFLFSLGLKFINSKFSKTCHSQK